MVISFVKGAFEALSHEEFLRTEGLDRCITQAVVAKSECPVCKSATLLYCLFKLDLSV